MPYIVIFVCRCKITTIISFGKILFLLPFRQKNIWLCRENFVSLQNIWDTEVEFEQYIIQGEPGRKERAENWQVAIGLQAVDGLKPSRYLLQTAQDHIEERISIDEVERRIAAYYQTEEGCREEEGTDEAD